jgi:tyrosine-protein phosphatase YwqE
LLLCKKIPKTLFFFKKNSPFLKDIIPNDYVDIHSHLLPNIDDGATSIDATKNMMTDLLNIGFKEFITTPHVIKHVWDNSKLTIEEKHLQTCNEIKEMGISNSFKVAAEYMLDDHFRTLISEEKLLTIKDNYVLVEMSYLNPPLALYDILFELQIAGYQPILAHPERYNFYHFALENYQKLKHAGCLFQLNLLSSVGYYGENVSKTADYLLKNNLIDFVGSDIHHDNHVASFDKKIVLKNHDILKTVAQNNLIFKS